MWINILFEGDKSIILITVYLGCALLCFMMLFFTPASYSPIDTADIAKPELRLRGLNHEENLVSRFD